MYGKPRFIAVIPITEPLAANVLQLGNRYDPLRLTPAVLLPLRLLRGLAGCKGPNNLQRFN